MSNSNELMQLPKREVANMAIRARNVLRKNVAAVAERKQAATHVVTSFIGGGAMGYWNGMTRADALAAGEDADEALKWFGVDREIVLGGALCAVGLFGPQKGKNAVFTHSALGLGTGVGSYYLGSVAEDMAMERGGGE